MTLSGSCHCGRVTVTLAARPSFVNDCNCSLCRKSGALWGYYLNEDVTVSGETRQYQRTDREVPIVNIHSCESCANTTHWTLTEPGREVADHPERMGVNMRLFEPSELIGIEKRFPNRADWTGGPELEDVKPPEW